MSSDGEIARDGELRSLATRPLTERVRSELLRSITDGLFPDGRLPSEIHPAQRLSVSRTTLRAALRSLEEEGVLSRQRGRGTRINAHVAEGLTLSRVVGFYDLIREAGYTPTIAWTKLTLDTAPEHWAARIGADAGASIVLIERLFEADGHPAIYLREMVAAERVRRMVEPEAVPNSIFEFAEQFCDRTVDHTVVEMVPSVAKAPLTRLLKLASGDPYLGLVETH